MMSRPVSAAAVVMGVFGVAATVYIFRTEIERGVMMVVGVGIGYRMLRHRFFPKAKGSRRRGEIEAALVGAAGGWFARSRDRRVKQDQREWMERGSDDIPF